jgi:hypothetical protein
MVICETYIHDDDRDNVTISNALSVVLTFQTD